MKTKFLLMALLLGSLVPVTAKNMAKKKQAGAKVIEAYTQKTVPGIPGAQGKTQYNFIIIWQGAKYPESFFWRGDNGWLSCRMLKAHRIANKNSSDPVGADYRTEQVTADKIHKGDTLQLTPIVGGKFPIPAEISADIKNTIFYQSGGKTWYPLPVNNIGHKKDIVMP